MASRIAQKLLKSARDGDVCAMERLGLLYVEGSEGLPQNFHSAFLWLQRAVEAGSERAAIEIGARIPPAALGDARAALPFYRAAAEAGHASASRFLAHDAFRRGEAAQGISWLTRAAERGDKTALVELASERKAVADTAVEDGNMASLYERAASEGSLAGRIQHSRRLIQEGRTAEAKPLLEALARMGEVESFHLLGTLLLAEGDRAGGVRAIERAATLGFGAAQELLADLHLRSRGVRVDGVAKSVRRSAHWLRLAARQGRPDAAFRLHEIHLGRRHRMHDPMAARVWLERAAAAGHAQAQYMLGVAELRDSTSDYPALIAAQWLVQAARSGHVEATALLERLAPAPPARTPDVAAAQARSVALVRAREPRAADRLDIAARLGLSFSEAVQLQPAAFKSFEIVALRAERGEDAARLVRVVADADRQLLREAAERWPRDASAALGSLLMERALAAIGLDWSRFRAGAEPAAPETSGDRAASARIREDLPR